MEEIPRRLSLSERIAGREPLVFALGAVLVGLCLLAVFATLLLRGSGDDILGGDEEPTPFPSPIAAVPDDVIVGGISGSLPLSLTLNAPVALQVGGQNYAVQTDEVTEDGVWSPQPGEGRTALWVYGTLINYVLGLSDNDENRDLLENLAAGAEAHLALRDGMRLTFSITSREDVPTSQADIFAQNIPSLTLILLQAQGDERLVVRGDYVVDPTGTGLDSPLAGNVVELGETAQLEDIRVTVTSAASVHDRPEAPPGFVFFLVDFQIQNAGSAAVNSSRLRFLLADELGNQYAMSPLASGLGSFDPLSGLLAPNETRTATVGYQIPAALASPSLSWIVSREGGAGQVRVTIPFTGSGAEAGQNATISLQSADVSADGTSLILVGQVANNGARPLIVGESNVSLVSDGTIHLMLSTNPAFPWIVPAGQTVPFTLSFQRPAGAQAVFNVLSQPYQLSGLR